MLLLLSQRHVKLGAQKEWTGLASGKDVRLSKEVKFLGHATHHDLLS